MTRWFLVSILLTTAAFAASAYVYFFQYDSLPEQIAVHWNIRGEPDSIVPRSEAWMNFWMAPFLMLLMVVLTVVLPWISPRQFEVERFRSTWEYVMALVVALFAFIHVALLVGSWGRSLPLGRFFVAGIMLFFSLLGNVLGRVKRNFWMGVRTPWTLASEPVWNQTHRVAGWLWAVGGLIGCVAILVLPLVAAVSEPAVLVGAFVWIMIIALYPVVYSLVLYKRLERHGKL
jgi:immunity protein, SdpI family